MFNMLLAAGTLLMVLVGCSGSTAPLVQPDVSVTGTILQIDDQTPVDGGVTITLKTDGDGIVDLFFGSLFTDPPPDAQTLALYEKIRELAVGNRILATGVRVEGGIGLENLVLLKQ